MAIALGLPIALLIYVGGFQGAADQLAAAAVAQWDEPAAREWLAWSQWLGGPSPRGLFLQARLARRGGQLEQMQKLLSQAKRLGLAPELIDRELVLAQAQTGQFGDVEAQLSSWLSRGDPDSRDICSAYANGLAAAGLVEDAAAVLAAWERDFPQDPRPLFRLGRISEYQQDYDTAEERYQAALERDADYLPAAFSLARMLANRRRVEDAIGYYRQCLQAENPVAAEIGLAVCLKATGEVEQAKQLLSQAVQQPDAIIAASYDQFEEAQDRALAPAELGKIEAELGNYAAATQWLEQALAANPRDSVTRFAYATALRGMGRSDDAQREFEQVRVAREQLAKATGLIERINKDPSDVAARIELGRIHLEYDSENRGLFWLRTVFSFDPDNRETHQILADYFASQPGPQHAELAAQHRRLAHPSE